MTGDSSDQIGEISPSTSPPAAEVVETLAQFRDHHGHSYPIALAPSGGFETDGDLVGWHRLDDLRSQVTVAAQVELITDVVGREQCPPGLPAAWAIERFGWFNGVLAFGVAIRYGVAPSFDPAGTWFRIDPHGMVDEVALEPEVAWVPTDSLAESLVGALAPMIEVLGTQGRPERTLWRHAGDMIAGSSIWAQDGSGFEGVEPMVEAVLAHDPRLEVPLRFGELEQGKPWRPRWTCCLARQVPGCPTCADCPLYGHDSKLGAAAG